MWMPVSWRPGNTGYQTSTYIKSLTGFLNSYFMSLNYEFIHTGLQIMFQSETRHALSLRVPETSYFLITCNFPIKRSPKKGTRF